MSKKKCYVFRNGLLFFDILLYLKQFGLLLDTSFSLNTSGLLSEEGLVLYFKYPFEGPHVATVTPNLEIFQLNFLLKCLLFFIVFSKKAVVEEIIE